MTRVHEYAKHAGVETSDVAAAIQEHACLDKMPHANATIQDEWLEVLEKKFSLEGAPEATPDIGSELQNVESEPEEVQGLNEELLERIAGLEERLAGRDAEVDRMNAEKVDAQQEREALETRAATLGQMIGGSTYIASSGKSVTVERGELIGYIPTKQASPGQQFSGGWIKVADDTDCSAHMTTIGVANKTFAYDPASGAPMHSVDYVAYKQWRKRGPKNKGGEPGSCIVGSREPRPIEEDRSRLIVGSQR